ncbi:hypothetical protein D9758_019053 [Tetrapyrgos nigripes]|uniref:Uncharacterized protein n=1 Tax=Tetrapyrgos nigripes TaxID=182062 RepID=A0A8H5AQT0_9AGAR|nr:hypothetical protein D9758_019053 [Tetrapyrgos nigripes]
MNLFYFLTTIVGYVFYASQNETSVLRSTAVQQNMSAVNSTVDLLILGAGWTSTFLIPLCKERNISYATTSRSGANDTIKFEFDQAEEDSDIFKPLPDAKTVLITFPITLSGGSERLVRLYKSTRHNSDTNPAFIQLGATSIWGTSDRSIARAAAESGSQAPIPPKPKELQWFDRHSPLNPGDRGAAETELLALAPAMPTTVLDLAGLWGGTRSMKNYSSIHMIHGIDVARAILAVHANFSKASGERWLLTDGRVYDWWDLASAWGSGSDSRNRIVKTVDHKQHGYAS